MSSIEQLPFVYDEDDDPECADAFCDIIEACIRKGMISAQSVPEESMQIYELVRLSGNVWEGGFIHLFRQKHALSQVRYNQLLLGEVGVRCRQGLSLLKLENHLVIIDSVLEWLAQSPIRSSMETGEAPFSDPDFWDKQDPLDDDVVAQLGQDFMRVDEDFVLSTTAHRCLKGNSSLRAIDWTEYKKIVAWE